jgi:hypothetical protein
MKTKSILFVILFITAISACSPTGTPVREPVYIGETEISAMLTDPPSISLHITGDLPTACHEFRYEYEWTQIGRLEVSVYSLISPAATCIQGLHAFDETIQIPATGQPDGTVMINLNGELIGEIILSGGD